MASAVRCRAPIARKASRLLEPELGQALIRAASIHHNVVQVRVVLDQHTIECFGQEAPLVQRGRNDRN